MWLEILIVVGLILSLLIYFLIYIKRIKHQKNELQRQLIEKSELLSYSAERERKALEQAAEIDQAKKKLLGRINHEIRTPMSGVMGMVTLLAETPLNNEQKEYNDTIRNCGDSLLTVINDILLGDVLAHSKVESNAAELEQKDFDLRNSIEEVFDVFASQAAQKDIELVYQIDHRIPSHIIGDNTRLRQVLMNLVENSVKFTKQGEILIRVSIKGEQSKTLDLGFEIKDSGCGISTDDLQFLSHSISQPGAQRSGVGLFLCNRLVGIMGGSLSLDSQLKEGTTVWFNIQVSSGSNGQRIHPEMVGVEGKKILVVEDNATLRNVLLEELLHWKLVPIVANSAEQALEILSEKRGVDLVLAEMQMPGMNGMQLSKSIRELYPALPIILITAPNDERSKQHPEILSSLVNKPIRHSVLSQHIFSGLIHKDEISVSEQTPAKQKLTLDFSIKYPLRILIAEDNPVNQKLAMKVLNKLGYKPDKVMNGKEVLEEVSKVDYDLILMDVQMPEMDGLEATRMIRLCLSSQPVIIAMTANAMQGDREECINAGMDDYLSKPVNVEELVIMLEKWALQVKAKK
jgi:CheY-like chemotaxis protein